MRLTFLNRKELRNRQFLPVLPIILPCRIFAAFITLLFVIRTMNGLPYGCSDFPTRTCCDFRSEISVPDSPGAASQLKRKSLGGTLRLGDGTGFVRLLCSFGFSVQ